MSYQEIAEVMGVSKGTIMSPPVPCTPEAAASLAGMLRGAFDLAATRRRRMMRRPKRELAAFWDGELPPKRAERVARQVRLDPHLGKP